MGKGSFTIPVNTMKIVTKWMEHVRLENRFFLPNHLRQPLENLSKFIQEHKSFKIKSGRKFYRARINKIGQSEPYLAQEIGSPPNGKASDGRLNPKGISYLYLAEKIDTAIAEVRPWVGANVTVGKFEINKDIVAADLRIANGMQVVGNKNIEDASSHLRFFLTIASSFSIPAHRDDDLAYIPTQYFSEMLKSIGYSAVIYDSVLHQSGYNLLVFDPNGAKAISQKVRRVKSVEYMHNNT